MTDGPEPNIDDSFNEPDEEHSGWTNFQTNWAMFSCRECDYFAIDEDALADDICPQCGKDQST